jgi:putative heme-binding domain-containing protein
MSRSRVSVVAGVVIAGMLSLTVKSHGQGANREDILQLQLSAAPGKNIAGGRALFEKHCATCHRFGPIGSDVGPDLTTVNSRFKKKDILESILFPSRTVSDQYQSEEIKTATATYNALLLRETPTALQIRVSTDPAKPVVVPKAQVTSREKSAVSFMPEGLIDKMNQADISNLITFIQTGPPKAVPAPAGK